MGIFLEDLLAGTTFDEFCRYLRENVISRDIYGSPPTQSELNQLFGMYDVDGDGVLSISEAEAANERLIRAINALRCALIVVDFQNDFVAGSLSIKHGPAQEDPMAALPPLNALLERQSRFRRVIYTMDWHPANHISFYEHCRNSDRTLSAEDRIRKLKPFDVVHFENPNFRQVLYPSHCVQNSWGAELCSDMIRAENAKYVLKGSQVFVDAYSGFVDNRGEYRSELESILKQEKIKTLFICGVALDICVAATARDAGKLGFLTAVILDCSKGLDNEQIRSTREELRALNVAFVDSKDVMAFIDHRRLPWRWIRQLVGLQNKSVSKMRTLTSQKSHVKSENSNINNGNITTNNNTTTSRQKQQQLQYMNSNNGKSRGSIARDQRESGGESPEERQESPSVESHRLHSTRASMHDFASLQGRAPAAPPLQRNSSQTDWGSIIAKNGITFSRMVSAVADEMASITSPHLSETMADDDRNLSASKSVNRSRNSSLAKASSTIVEENSASANHVLSPIASSTIGGEASVSSSTAVV